jgi:hypothetical protein
MKTVVIDWVDSVRAFDWTLIEDVDEKSLDCISVGFLLNETKEHVTIAQNYGIKPEQVCNLITIPKCSIRNIREIKQEYTWKPSEEQMKILRHLDKGTPLNDFDKRVLQVLIEQLNKLKA